MHTGLWPNTVDPEWGLLERGRGVSAGFQRCRAEGAHQRAVIPIRQAEWGWIYQYYSRLREDMLGMKPEEEVGLQPREEGAVSVVARTLSIASRVREIIFPDERSSAGDPLFNCRLADGTVLFFLFGEQRQVGESEDERPRPLQQKVAVMRGGCAAGHLEQTEEMRLHLMADEMCVHTAAQRIDKQNHPA